MKKIYYGIDSESCEVRGKEIYEENGRTTFTIVSEGQEYPAIIPPLAATTCWTPWQPLRWAGSLECSRRLFWTR